ncbi:lysozyme [Eleftheria terrae]|uniref:lysozyme n=1 Tax=Eleftheria terrae TaxID=1597781 RepID=UPI00263BDB05|nr:lysozyme [Eleftheria terrae]WKB52325.1 lysozyme [Eleftheria terrae]
MRAGAAVAALAVSSVVTFEGTVPRTYRDPVGILTACRGHTGPELRMGQQFTPDQCDELMYIDLLEAEADIACIKQPLRPHEKAAFISFAFNVGREKFCASTLARKANAGDLAGACAELSRWVWAGGQQLPGLVRRRAHERAMCEGRVS